MMFEARRADVRNRERYVYNIGSTYNIWEVICMNVRDKRPDNKLSTKLLPNRIRNGFGGVGYAGEFF